jgi:hypothetical protein
MKIKGMNETQFLSLLQRVLPKADQLGILRQRHRERDEGNLNFLFGHGGIDFNAAAHRAVRQGDLDRNRGSIFIGSKRHVTGAT